MVDKLEKKLGKYAINNLIFYILGGYVLGYIFYFTNSGWGIYDYITLEPAKVMAGQVWRLFTWIITIPQSLSFFIIFMFLFFYFIGKSLEQTMGAFRYNLYMFSGWFFMTLGSMAVYWITYGVYGSAGAISIDASTYYINMASFLAFAVLYPNVRVYFFGIIPIKVKILAWIDAGLISIEAFSSVYSILAANSQNEILLQVLEQYNIDQSYLKVYAFSEIFTIFFAMLNFLIFFLMNRKSRGHSAGDAKRRYEFERSAQQGRRQNAAYTAGGAGAYSSKVNSNQANEPKKNYRPAGGLVHKCEICGRTSDQYPELQFRYCSKCNGNHEYCQDHIFTHQHHQ